MRHGHPSPRRELTAPIVGPAPRGIPRKDPVAAGLTEGSARLAVGAGTAWRGIVPRAAAACGVAGHGIRIWVECCRRRAVRRARSLRALKRNRPGGSCVVRGGHRQAPWPATALGPAAQAGGAPSGCCVRPIQTLAARRHPVRGRVGSSQARGAGRPAGAARNQAVAPGGTDQPCVARNRKVQVGGDPVAAKLIGGSRPGRAEREGGGRHDGSAGGDRRRSQEPQARAAAVAEEAHGVGPCSRRGHPEGL